MAKKKRTVGRPKGSKNKRPVGRPKGSKTKRPVGRPKGSKTKRPVGRPKGSKNKRPVGRPKGSKNKRPVGRPKGSRNRQVNQGFSVTSYNRVRKLLWDNFKDDFTSYREFISNIKDENGQPIKGTSIVSRVYNECKGVRCLDRDILLIYEQLARIDSVAPEFDIELTEYADNYYWMLMSEPSIYILPPNLWLTCPQCLIDPDFFLGVLGNDTILDKDGEPTSLRKFDAEKGDTLIYGKKQRFKPFVDYLNRMYAELGDDVETDQMARFRFVGQIDKKGNRLPLAVWNEELNRWEVEIEITDENGDRTNYGFVPTPDGDYTPVDLPYTPPVIEDEEEVEEIEIIDEPLDEVDKKLNRLLKKKADIREDIRLWKDVDEKEEMKKSIAELKKVNDQINKIT